MSKIQAHQRDVDKKGSNYVKRIVEDEIGGTYETIFRDYDYRFDCYIHLYENKTVDDKIKKIYLPMILRAQLKSGDSYFKNETEDFFEISINEKDIYVWKESNTPVLLIVYNESRNKAYWINIREYIERSSYYGKGALKVIINKKMD